MKILSIKSPNSPLLAVDSHLFDTDEDKEEEEEDGDNDDEEAANEYDYFFDESSDELEDNETEITSVEYHEEDGRWHTKESKRQRVGKIRNEVEEFGIYIIDVDELASVYDFCIDRFQVCFGFIFRF